MVIGRIVIANPTREQPTEIVVSGFFEFHCIGCDA
jgi:hypothetical protein